jgi:ESCRT-II complex subunit VPS25
MASQGSSSKSGTFIFPREHNFPPFYTRQSNLTTLHAQLQKWSALILSYHSFHQLTRLTLSSALSSPLFNNTTINRRVSESFLKEIVEFMVKEGRAEYIGGKGGKAGAVAVGGGGTVWIWYKRPEEWAQIIHEWVEETAQKNTVLTLYELTESEATLSQGMFLISVK